MIWNSNFQKLCRTDVNQLFQMNETHNLLIYLAVWESSSFIITSVCSWTIFLLLNDTLLVKIQKQSQVLKKYFSYGRRHNHSSAGRNGLHYDKVLHSYFSYHHITRSGPNSYPTAPVIPLYRTKNVVFKQKRSHYLFIYLFMLTKYTGKCKVCYSGQVSPQWYCASSIY